MAELQAAQGALPEVGRLQRLGRKLDSWEILLESESRFSGIPEREVAKRRKRLLELRQRFEILRLQIESPPIQDGTIPAQLPPLDLCSGEERQLCEQYLDAQLKISQHLREQLLRVMQWVDQAATGQKNSWRAKMRLSKIRRYLMDLDQERQSLDPHRAKQTHNWEILADRLLLYRDRNAEVSDARLAFEKIVRLTNNVAKLQSQVHQLQNRTSRMDNWLKQAHRQLKGQKAPLPPLAEDLRLVTQKIDILGLEDLNRSKSRINLARRYLEKYLQRETNSSEGEYEP